MEQYSEDQDHEPDPNKEFRLLLDSVRSRLQEELAGSESVIPFDLHADKRHWLLIFRLAPPDGSDQGYTLGVPIAEPETPWDDEIAEDPEYFAIKPYTGDTMDMDIIDEESYVRLEAEVADNPGHPYADLLSKILTYNHKDWV